MLNIKNPFLNAQSAAKFAVSHCCVLHWIHHWSLTSRPPVYVLQSCLHTTTPTHSKWSHPLSGGEVEAPEVVEGGTGGRAPSKDVHGLVEIAGAVREAISDCGAFFIPDVGPDHLTAAQHLVEVSLHLYYEVWKNKGGNKAGTVYVGWYSHNSVVGAWLSMDTLTMLIFVCTHIRFSIMCDYCDCYILLTEGETVEYTVLLCRNKQTTNKTNNKKPPKEQSLFAGKWVSNISLILSQKSPEMQNVQISQTSQLKTSQLTEADFGNVCHSSSSSSIP